MSILRSIKLCFYQRLALSLVLVFLLVLAVFFAGSVHLQRVAQDAAEQRLHIDLPKHLIADNPLLVTGAYNNEALKNLFHTLMVMGPNFEFYYLDPQGKILTYSTELGPIARTKVDLNPIAQLLDANTSLPIKGDDPRSIHGRKIFTAAPITNESGLQGFIYIIIGGKNFDSIFASVQKNAAIQQFVLFAGAALVFLLVALLVLFRYFTKPMKMLSDDMDKVRAADFDKEVINAAIKPWKRDSHNEVQRLGCAFNDVLEHIKIQFACLEQTDQQRRILLADLSHDLRTPLANLQGYIETLDIQNDSLTSDERKRFVDISLKNARNLKHLIDQIFDLAYLEAGQVNLNAERFSLGELCHDTLAKFAIKAKQKNIRLGVNLPNKHDVFVTSDIGKLERILSNLLDNAIRHTPDNGTVSLSVDVNTDEVIIQVEDSGNGIHQHELPFVFNARYQASNQCLDNKTHAGLGLAICKKLSAIISGELSVTSKVNEGTCFRLTIQA
uniref:sensor histidine kinase n=1 Tax=Ningiella ruwaisensis TaxID=2364274 RepID=UPI001F4F2D7C|nr:HAMP domain-containing sensor histidine kinase [Ningiella ruwaisensis]